MSTLIAITYDTADKAKQVLEELNQMQKMKLITLEDERDEILAQLNKLHDKIG